VAGGAPKKKYAIRELDGDCRQTNLRLDRDDGALAVFLKNNARKLHDESIGKTYVIVDLDETPPRTVYGYITILVSEIVNGATKVEAVGEGYNYHWPAVKIARLAVDARHRGNDLGRDLVAFCIALVTEEIMPRVGCRFITVDSNKPAIGFYEKMGFIMVDTPENRGHHTPVMFLDVHKLREAARAAAASGVVAVGPGAAE